MELLFEELLEVLANDVQRYVKQAEDGQFKISDYGRRVMREYEKATPAAPCLL